MSHEKTEKTQPCGEDFEPGFEGALNQAATAQLVWLPGLGAGGRSLPLAIFARRAWIAAPEGFGCDNYGQRVGVEIVAYGCDDAGRVLDTTRRYHEHGADADAAIRRLHLKLANGLAWLHAPEADYVDTEDLLARDWNRLKRTL